MRPSYIQFGIPGTAVSPGPADYDGDGKADIGFHNPADHYWYIVQSGTGLPVYINWGVSTGDVPVVADYDGDGKADCAFYEPSGRTFYIIRSSTGSAQYVTIPGNAAGDIPVLRRPQ